MHKKKDVEGLYSAVIGNNIELSDSIVVRAKEIMAQTNLKAFDSLHLASAEMCADVLLTTDIKFLNACKRIATSVKVMNPVEFVMEANDGGHID